MATFIIQQDGSLLACGRNNYSQTGLGGTTNILTLTQVGTDIWKSIASDAIGAIGIKNDNTMWAVGSEAPYRRFGLGTSPTAFTQVNNKKWLAVSLATDSAIALDDNRTLWGTGANSHGQIGLGATSEVSVFTLISADKWSQVVTKNRFMLGIKEDGTLWSTGDNASGQLGLGDTTTRKTLQQVGTAKWKYISAGDDFVFGIQEDGSLWSWGKCKSFGNLGIGEISTIKTTPQLVSNAEWKQCSCGVNHALAIKSDGTLWGAGYNHIGQFGNGTQTSSDTLIKISSAIWALINADYETSFGILTDGQVRCAGMNNEGQLGLGDTSYRIWFTTYPFANSQNIFNIAPFLPKPILLLLLKSQLEFYTINPYLQKLSVNNPPTGEDFINYGFTSTTDLMQKLSIQQQEFEGTNNIYTVNKPDNWTNLRIE